MKLNKMKLSSTYGKIILSMIIIIDFIILIFAGIVFNVFKISVKSEINKWNTRTVRQMKTDIIYMEELVENYAMLEYYASDVQNIINSKQIPDSNDLNRTFNRITMTSSLQNMLYSVVLYNGFFDRVYPDISGAFEEDMYNILHDKNLTAFKAYPVLVGKDKSEGVFTYVIYRSKNKMGYPDSAILINVRMDWLRKYVNIDKSADSNIYLLSKKDGKIIFDVSGKYKIGDTIDREYLGNIKNEDFYDTQKDYKINGVNTTVTVSSVEFPDMVLVVERNSETLYGGIRKVQAITIILTLIFMFIGIIVSYRAGNRLYNPIRKIINAIRLSNDSIDKNIDDVELITDFTKKIKSGSTAANELVRKNMFREFVTNPDFFTNDMKEQYIIDNDFLNSGNKFFLVILLAEKNRDFVENTVLKKIDDIRIEYRSIECEKNMVLVFKGMECEHIREVLTVETQNMSEFGVYAFISDYVDNAVKISNVYEMSMALFKYRIFFDDKCVFDENDINYENFNSQIDYPKEIEKNILLACSGGNINDMKEAFEVFLNKLSVGSYENYKVSILRLSFSLVSQHSALLNMEIPQKLIEDKSKEEIKRIFHSSFAVIEKKHLSGQGRSDFIVNTIKDYINMNFNDIDLCSKSIASEMNMSVAYLGRIFRDKMQMSISEYINDIRMKKVAELLVSTNTNINEIVTESGYDGITKFYRIFKQKYGVTPSEYRIKYFDVDGMQNQ